MVYLNVLCIEIWQKTKITLLFVSYISLIFQFWIWAWSWNPFGNVRPILAYPKLPSLIWHQRLKSINVTLSTTDCCDHRTSDRKHHRPLISYVSFTSSQCVGVWLYDMLPAVCWEHARRNFLRWGEYFLDKFTLQEIFCPLCNFKYPMYVQKGKLKGSHVTNTLFSSIDENSSCTGSV